MPDGAIGPEGRTVRCAKCRHSWFEQPGGTIAPEPAAPQFANAEPANTEPQTAFAGEPQPATPGANHAEAAAAPSSGIGQASPADEVGQQPAVPPREEMAPAFADPVGADPVGADRLGAEAVAPEPIAADPVSAPVDPALGDPAPVTPAPAQPTATPATPAPVASAPIPAMPDADAASEDYYDDEPAPRRSWLRLAIFALVVALAVAAAAFAAVRYYGAPAWLPVGQTAFGPPSANLELDFPAERQDRRTMPNGLQFFAASGTVTNIGKAPEQVPDVQVVLRDAQNRVVYTWQIEPPQRELAPGEAISINEAVTDVPASARVVEIGWKAG